ncbi:DUF4157 domain-containing protein [Dendronalium sp. ChiSLP03b]|uniref:eCIS core domain-containing protein n=1 Tax=Dendronalium sp. ChiSLP03b TaxID=3075381 RepID=UPI002AD5554A|nr:DUF4157 domain-containing protein [Dendronalium sp. ChiSLP03b]MDZ8203794.1 DUF4157 domain-containing protein [Dendronalium sp. ChiSLP03b]
MKRRETQKSTHHQPATRSLKPFFGAAADRVFFATEKAQSTPFFPAENFNQQQATPAVQRMPAFESEVNSNGAALVQRQTDMGSELQDKESVQRQVQEEKPIQTKVDGNQPAEVTSSQMQQPNNTGLPDNLKGGIENLSGISMDDVKVYYNSAKPAQVQALAYTQGTDIHVAPGQEKHLPHEAWHVVQQKQGRVKPTLQAKGVAINDDMALEREADAMGDKAFQRKQDHTAKTSRLGAFNRREESPMPLWNQPVQKEVSKDVIQKRTRIEYDPPQNFSYHDPAAGLAGVGHFPAINAQTPVGRSVHAELDLNDPVQGSGVGGLIPAALMASLSANYPGINWVQGHLLNANLGGLGIASNLAPITHDANMHQLWVVEQPVKRLLYNQPGGNYQLANAGYVEYNIVAQPLNPALNSWQPDVNYQCSWRNQLPQAMPPAPGAAPLWTPWQTHTVSSISNQTPVGVPPAWNPFGAGMGVPQGGGGVVNVAFWNIAHVTPAFIHAIGGMPAWAPPAHAQQVITQPGAAVNTLKIVGWQF